MQKITIKIPAGKKLLNSFSTASYVGPKTITVNSKAIKSQYTDGSSWRNDIIKKGKKNASNVTVSATSKIDPLRTGNSLQNQPTKRDKNELMRVRDIIPEDTSEGSETEGDIGQQSRINGSRGVEELGRTEDNAIPVVSTEQTEGK